MTEVNPEDMLNETIKVLKSDDIERVKRLTTGPTSRLIVETKGVEPSYNIEVRHPGIARFMDDGSLVAAGEDLPFIVISAGGWHNVTVEVDEEEAA